MEFFNYIIDMFPSIAVGGVLGYVLGKLSRLNSKIKHLQENKDNNAMVVFHRKRAEHYQKCCENMTKLAISNSDRLGRLEEVKDSKREK